MNSSEQRIKRLLCIELLAWWEGSVSNKQLQDEFAISRQQAYQDLKDYQQHCPDNLIAVNGGYQVSPQFSANYLSLDVAQYLQWFSTGSLMLAQQVNPLTSLLSIPKRSVSVVVMRQLIKAIRYQQRLEVDYVSLSNPENDGRIFHPHTFVNTGLRWHVRGYCEKSRDYRDLVLSRFSGEGDILGDSEHKVEDDKAWQTFILLIIQADPRLSAAQQAVLANDYQMEGGQLIINTRAALANYLLQELHINTKMLDGTPEAQQLVLVNINEVKPWLFNG
ncbi:WYL domain-containing protein [Shewanella sp. SR44-3]|uniref:WYL domain-containing protein n=1 Tax=Shewanella sp. SR44-3 TaxID=2760936 RepID=UPI0015FBA343|nr:WYL domain-containing protein [Shewanella sp. SR44-3]MBB1270225.1 WYL domain-containing protein [Shewanella sp. SR44-3]